MSDAFTPGVVGGPNSVVVFDHDGLPTTPDALILGGWLQSIGATHAQSVARQDGDEWVAMDEGLAATYREDFQLMVLDDDSARELYIGSNRRDSTGNYLAGLHRWDGAAWQAVAGIPAGPVRCMAALPDNAGGSTWFVAGYFPDGVTPHSGSTLLRRVGESWEPMLSCNYQSESIHAMVVGDLGDGPRLFISGRFLFPGEMVSTTRIMSFDGASWDTLATSVGGSNLSPGIIYTMMVAADPQTARPTLYVGGDFETIDGQPLQNIARLVDASWSDVGGGLPGVIRTLAIEHPAHGSAIYAAGEITHPAWAIPSQRAGVARWSGGDTWTISPQPLRYVRDLTWHGNELAAVGHFPGGLAHFDHETWRYTNKGLVGSVISGYGEKLPFVSDMDVFAGADGQPMLYACGHFALAGEAPSPSIARFDGARWHPLGSGVAYQQGDEQFGPFVYSMEVIAGLDDQPALYVSGYFNTAGGTHAYGVARWDGAHWSPLGDGINGYAGAIAAFDDGLGDGPSLYVFGEFTHAGGVPCQDAARWDGENWHAIPGLNGQVYALLVHDDGSGPALYAGGEFTLAGSTPVRNLAKWNGREWSDVGGGVQGGLRSYVLSLAVYDDGSGAPPRLAVGGSFSVAGELPARSIALWNGASWQALSSGITGTVYDMQNLRLGSDLTPKLVAVGPFAQAGGTHSPYMAVWNGSFWSGPGFTLGTLENWGYVSRIRPFDAGDGDGPQLFVSGQFISVGGVPAGNIARITGCRAVEIPMYDDCGYALERIIAPPCVECSNQSPEARLVAMNQPGTALGSYFVAPNIRRPFLWSQDGGFATLGMPSDVTSIDPVDINDHGVVLASAHSPIQGQQAYVFDGATWTWLDSPMSNAPTAPVALNNEGTVVGSRLVYGGSEPVTQAFIRTVSGFEMLNPDGASWSIATDINNAGVVILNASVDNVVRAYRWNRGVFDMLAVPEGALHCKANAINDHGEIAGYATFPSSQPYGRYEAVVWTGAGVNQLGALSGHTDSEATCISERGEVAGRSWVANSHDPAEAFIWSGSRMQRLDDLASTDEYPWFEVVVGFDQAGRIALHDRSGGVPPTSDRAVILTPNSRQPTDINGDCGTDVDDLVLVIFAWGPAAPGSPNAAADVNADGVVNIDDLLDVIEAWTLP